ncbi:hypothetical protein D3C87_1870200 [compost metagenome]
MDVPDVRQNFLCLVIVVGYAEGLVRVQIIKFMITVIYTQRFISSLRARDSTEFFYGIG